MPDNAIVWVGDITGANSKVSGTSLAVPVPADIPIGSLIVLVGAADNTGSLGSTPTITAADNSSQSSSGPINVYTTSLASSNTTAAGQGVVGHLCYCRTTRKILSGNSINITYSLAIVAKAMVGWWFAGATSSLRGVVTTQKGGTTSPLCGSGTAPTLGDLVVGYSAHEDAAAAGTVDGDTTNGAWSASLSNGTTGSTADTDVWVDGQWKVVNADGSQNYGIVLGAATDWTASMAIFQPGRYPSSRVMVSPSAALVRSFAW